MLATMGYKLEHDSGFAPNPFSACARPPANPRVSMQGTAIFPGSTTYAAPKAALVHTARILAKQWKIQVNVVAPGVNNAGMAEQSVRSGKYDPYLEKKVIPRFGRPEDVARAILFFLEPDNYVTGQVLTVDGGLSLKTSL